MAWIPLGKVRESTRRGALAATPGRFSIVKAMFRRFFYSRGGEIEREVDAVFASRLRLCTCFEACEALVQGQS